MGLSAAGVSVFALLASDVIFPVLVYLDFLSKVDEKIKYPPFLFLGGIQFPVNCLRCMCRAQNDREADRQVLIARLPAGLLRQLVFSVFVSFCLGLCVCWVGRC